MLKIFKRRALSITLYLIIFILYSLLFPFTIIISLMSDLFIRKKFPVSRGAIFLLLYLIAEIVGIIISFFLWIITTLTKDNLMFIRHNYYLQVKWAGFLAYSSFKLFGIKVEIEGKSEIGRGPVIVFMRHTSVADTIIPAIFISVPNNIILRYVLKKELLLDPCIDIVGNRLKNYFVNRNSENNALEIKEVGLLAKDLKEGEGVIIYPEGTRFSKSKFEKIIEKLKQNNDLKIFEKASSLKYVLPPRLGGTIELLKNNTNADVIFCSHTGLEGSASFKEFMNGKLINQTLRIKVWKITFDNIPTEKESQIEWLYENWKKVDSFVEETINY